MADPVNGGLRIWGGGPANGFRPPPACSPEALDGLVPLAEELARQETMRPGGGYPAESADVLSLQWFLDLQSLRHHRQGHWMPRLLEFSRHSGDRLLGLGDDLGSDLIEYARNGTEVVAACPSARHLELIRRHFELRGFPVQLHHAPATALPIESSSIDVVKLSGVLHEHPEPGRLVEEIYRVLKPGGKLLAVLPAHYDVDYWRRFLAFGEPREPQDHLPLLHSAKRYRSAEVKQLFARFTEPRLYKRHLRRLEVPHLYRWLPLSVLERFAGRLLVFKAFRPVSSAIGDQAAA